MVVINFSLTKIRLNYCIFGEILWTLTDREKIIAVISNGIAVFFIVARKRKNFQKNTTMYDFVSKSGTRRYQIRIERRN